MLFELKFKINIWGARLLKMILTLNNIIVQDTTEKSRQAHEDVLSRLSHFLIFVSTIIWYTSEGVPCFISIVKIKVPRCSCANEERILQENIKHQMLKCLLIQVSFGALKKHLQQTIWRLEIILTGGLGEVRTIVRSFYWK